MSNEESGQTSSASDPKPRELDPAVVDLQVRISFLEQELREQERALLELAQQTQALREQMLDLEARVEPRVPWAPTRDED